MAYNASDMTLVSSVNGYGLYRYDTMDVHATVDTTGYFNNTDDTLNLAVGDIIDVVVWATAIRSGTISTYGRHIVNSVSSGVVDITNVTVGVMTDTD